MSDKSDIEAIRAVKRWKIHSEVTGHDITPFRQETAGIWDDEVVLASDYLSHIDALEARITQLEGALRGLHDDVVDYQRINHLGGYDNHWLVQARAALAKGKV